MARVSTKANLVFFGGGFLVLRLLRVKVDGGPSSLF